MSMEPTRRIHYPYIVFIEPDGTVASGDWGGYFPPTTLKRLADAFALTVELCDYTDDDVEQARVAAIREYEDECTAREASSPPRKQKAGCVYLMKDDHTGLYKIGYSTNPKAREGTLQSVQPALRLVAKAPGTYKHEAWLHARFADKRERGEWFALTPDDVRILILKVFDNES